MGRAGHISLAPPDGSFSDEKVRLASFATPDRRRNRNGSRSRNLRHFFQRRFTAAPRARAVRSTDRNPRADLLHQVSAARLRRFAAKRELAEIAANDGELSIVRVPESVNSPEETIDSHGGEKTVDADHGRTIFIDALNIKLPTQRAVPRGICAASFFRPDLFGGNRARSSSVGPPGL